MCGIWAFLPHDPKDDIQYDMGDGDGGDNNNGNGCGDDSINDVIDISYKRVSIADTFHQLRHRGPDASALKRGPNGELMGFHRLSIVDLSDKGMQPFVYDKLMCLCNGEIYNWELIEQELSKTIQFRSECDCEVIAPLFDYLNGDMARVCNILDGEFAFIIYDNETQTMYYATDELSTRPLFIGYSDIGVFISSEMAAISDACDSIIRVPGGHYGRIIAHNNKRRVVGPAQYFIYEHIDSIRNDDCSGGGSSNNRYIPQLTDLLTNNIIKKLHTGERADGFFLSGGVDSSIVCAVAAKHRNMPINTYTIGFSEDSPDVVAARIVSEHIKSIHHEYIISYDDAIAELPNIVRALGSYCQTTVRASVPMYMLLKCIKEERKLNNQPPLAIMYTGELADELFGSYKYLAKAPDSVAHRNERIRLLKRVHMYDGLRCDRVCNQFSIEARYPFFSKELLRFTLSLPPQVLCTADNDGIEKKILRDAFSEYLPHEIMYRAKEAFSDATSVKSSWKDQLIAHATTQIDTERFANRALQYPYATPNTPEDMWYRDLFSRDYAAFANTIPGNWLPLWHGDVIDSSATVLADLP